MTKPSKKSSKITWPLLTILGLCALWIAWQYRLPPVPPTVPIDYQAERAIWMDITWAMDAHTDEEIMALSESLKSNHIDYIFPYVSYLKSGDFFNTTYDHAQNFVAKIHEFAPSVQVLAWIGVPIIRTSPDENGGFNRLKSKTIRDMIATFSAHMVNDYGFDGIHLNAEPVFDGDNSFIETLQAIRAALPPSAILSTTAHALQMTKRVTIFPYPIVPEHQSTDYLRQIAENSDQVVLMAYDSGLFFPSDYRVWIIYQGQTSAAALEGLDVNFLIGVPASEEMTPSHNTTTEYLANALYGVQAVLADSNYRDNIDGISIYPDWELSDKEWELINTFP